MAESHSLVLELLARSGPDDRKVIDQNLSSDGRTAIFEVQSSTMPDATLFVTPQANPVRQDLEAWVTVVVADQICFYDVYSQLPGQSLPRADCWAVLAVARR